MGARLLPQLMRPPTLIGKRTARARVGYAQDNWLFYATGGFAILGTKATFTPALGLTCGSYTLVNCSGTNEQIGAALGAGVEYGITAKCEREA